jgi:hypothetical protein
MTYSTAINMKSRYQYQHVPGNHGEPNMLDTFCTMHPTKQPSACYTNPSYFLLQDDMPMPARLLLLLLLLVVASWNFSSQNGYALCRQTGYGEICPTRNGTATTLGVDTKNVGEWGGAHLSKKGKAQE